jgi:4-amino-4-deoxy-L-arabinose transferase-like glycosyltransferase
MRPWLSVASVVTLGTVLRLLLAAWVPLTTDEAYYVDWARHLQPGYLDHPPAVAWLLAAGLRLLGERALAVRLPAVALLAGTTLLAAALVEARAGRRAALAAALLLQVAPVFSLGGALMTPDAPLAFAWAGTLWAAERALRSGPRWWLAAGAFLGLGLLSKLSAGLLGLALLGGLLASSAGRRALATPWPWAGALLAVAVATPMLAWNAARDWPSLAFQADHGLRGGGFSGLRLLGSVGAQAGYVSPLLAVLAAAAAWRAWRGGAVERLLAASALPVILFFTAAAAFTPGALPHWPAPGWLSATLLLAMAGHRRLEAAGWLGAAACALLVSALALPLPESPLDELRGWEEGAAGARAVAGGAPIAAAHWMALGHLGWAGGAPLAYVGSRRCAATSYEPDPLAAGTPLLLVQVVGLGEDRAALEARLGPLLPRGEATVRRGERTLRTYRYWLRPGRVALAL